jgi:hypothetical protein
VTSKLPHAWRRAGALALSAAFALAAGAPSPGFGRQEAAAKQDEKPAAEQTETPEAAALRRLQSARSKKPTEWNGEDIAALTALAYRGANFAQFKKVFNTGREEGRITIATTNGELDGEYLRRYSYGAKMEQDRVRLDITFMPNQSVDKQLRYTLTYNGASVWAAQNNRYVTPEPAAALAYKASVVNDYTALFRWAEEGATLARLPNEKIQGFDLDVVEMTRPDGSKMRFYISPKTYRILHVDYEVVLGEGQNPTPFRESYTDWQVIQEVLVPRKRKLRQNGQVIQTIELLTGVYGQAVEDSVFLQL